jgi:hypothetical protein
LPEVRGYLDDALADPWTAMRRYRRAAVIDGLRAAEPSAGLVEQLMRIAEGGLRRRGRGEETLLGPLWERLDMRASPGERARTLARGQGIDAFVEAASYRSAAVLG